MLLYCVTYNSESYLIIAQIVNLIITKDNSKMENLVDLETFIGKMAPVIEENLPMMILMDLELNILQREILLKWASGKMEF